MFDVFHRKIRFSLHLVQSWWTLSSSTLFTRQDKTINFIAYEMKFATRGDRMSLVTLTDAGMMLLQANTGPVTVTTYELGSGYDYTPEATATMLMGTEVWSGTVPAPLAVKIGRA